ncbi:MAG: DUF2326 domain-containing protein [Parabacteroides sp.]
MNGNTPKIIMKLGNYNNGPCYQFLMQESESQSAGMKQSEISSFELAYIQFAEQEKIPCLHFLLFDKLELRYGNQLINLAKTVEEMGNVQMICAVLKDKLPRSLRSRKYIAQSLSPDNKFFKIESWVNLQGELFD